MAVFVYLGKQRLPFRKCALVIDVDMKNVYRNLENFKKHNIKIVRYDCYDNPEYKYMWTIYTYVGDDNDFALTVQEMQDRVLLCGYDDYIDEVTKMVTLLTKLAPDLKVHSYDLEIKK